MVVKTKEIIDAVSVVTSNHNIRVTVKSSLKSSLQVAGATFIGALVRKISMVKFIWLLKIFNPTGRRWVHRES